VIRLSSRRQDDVVVLSLDGELDGRSATTVHQELMEQVPPQGPVLLDLSRLTYLSSGGLRLLYLVARKAEGEPVKVALSGLSQEVRGVLAATGFLQFFTVTDTVQDALQALAG
jgi:anti-sigma B factor antagonist